MRIFDMLKVYGKGTWTVSNSRNFSKDEQDLIEKAEVVPSDYGNSVCFTMVGGGMTYIPLSNTSTKGVGDTIDLATAKLLTLSKQGENDIYRVDA